MVSVRAWPVGVLCLLLFVTGLFVAGVDPVGAHQPPTPAPDSPPVTPVSEPTPEPPAPPEPPDPPAGNESGDNNQTGGGGRAESGNNSTISFPTPKEMLKGWLRYSIESISRGVDSFIGAFNHIFYGLPAPGTPTDPTTWSSPSGGWWPSVWKLYLLFTPLGAFAAITAATLATSRPPAERRAWLRDAFKSLGMIVFGWYVAAAGLHLGNELSLALAPSSSEFFATPGSMTKLGFGLILAAIIAYFELVVIVWAVVVLFIQWFLAHILVAFWPLFWGFRAIPSETARPFAGVGVAGLGTLIVLKIFQAGVLRFMFEIPWGLNSPLTTLMSLVGTAVGLIVATILLPGIAVKKLLPAAMIAAGKRRTPDDEQIERLRDRAREQLGGVLEQYRGGGTGGAVTAGSDRRQIGSVQRRVASYSRPGGSPGPATRSGDASGWGRSSVGPVGRPPPEHDDRGYE